MGGLRSETAQTAVAMGPVHASGTDAKISPEMSTIERMASPDDLKKDAQDYGRIDAEVAKYANAARIDISEAESKRLRKMIDRRVSIPDRDTSP